MSIWPLFFGFVLGVAIGTIATVNKATELHQQAKDWLPTVSWRRLRELAARGPRAVLVALPEMQQVQVLFILVSVWIAGLALILLFSPPWDHTSSRDYILASLVGGATAPWILLHFDSRLQRAPEPDDAQGTAGASRPGRRSKQGPADPPPASRDDFSRYQFMTYVLGAVLLVVLLQPYLARWLPLTNKIEVLGMAFTFAPSRTDRVTAIDTTSTASGSTAISVSRFAQATTLNSRLSNGLINITTNEPFTLADVSDMKGFTALSMMDRDKVYIAYFIHARNAEHGNLEFRRTFANLQAYVDAAGVSIYAPDANFIAKLKDLSRCISDYVQETGDFRLFFLDTKIFLQELTSKVARRWGSPPDAGQQELLDVGNLPSNLAKFAHPRPQSTACKDVDNVVGLLRRVDLDGVGRTPYPAYLIAHYMAAVDSVDSGALILRDWIKYHRLIANDGDSQLERIANEWYNVRALIALGLMPSRFGSVAPTHLALVQFQKTETDRMAALLGVGTAQTWRAFCKKLDQFDGFHKLVGKYLALTYADERNYLFELLRPADFGLPPPGQAELISAEYSPRTYLEEAEAIQQMPECFASAAEPERLPRMLGLFALNAAQLRYSVRLIARGPEAEALTQEILADLERAKQLGKPRRSVSDPDLLDPPDEFDSARLRLGDFSQRFEAERNAQ
ncbi:hypothetical protein [Rhodopseudomonas palustris]|uniref:hypothetical protein n=1 Tax=Rhodopseudomonas palustris TaxID=1076 RepID=UPI0005A01020